MDAVLQAFAEPAAIAAGSLERDPQLDDQHGPASGILHAVGFPNRSVEQPYAAEFDRDPAQRIGSGRARAARKPILRYEPVDAPHE